MGNTLFYSVIVTYVIQYYHSNMGILTWN